MQLCTTSPLPSFSDIYNSFASNLTVPPFHFTMPQLPTLPSPMFPSIKMPNLEMVTTMMELQLNQMMNTIMGMLTPLTSFLSLDLSSILPTVPVLNLKLPDILNGNPSALLQSVKDKIAAGFTFPGIPSPLFPDIHMPDLSSLMTMVNLIKSYITQLPATIFGLIGQVTNKLHIGAMPSLPTMPTMDQIQAQVIAALPPLPQLPNPQTYADLLKAKIPANLAFNFTIPGFPAIPKLPDPLVPSIHMPEFDFYVGFGNMVDHIATYSLQQCMNFCNTISQITFSFPTMCIPFNPA